MSYNDTVNNLAEDAEQLEQLYQSALKAGETEAFKGAIDDSHISDPENLLYAAWFHRLKIIAAQTKEHVVAWAWVIPLAVINAFLFWWLSGERFMISIEQFRGGTSDFLPAIAWLAAPLSAAFVLIYFTGNGNKRWPLSAIIGVVLLACGAYVLLTYPQTGIGPFQEQYLTLMIMHLPLLAWAGVGGFLIARHRDATSRFSFLLKSLELFIVGGLFLIAIGLFTAISVGLFDALDVNFPEVAIRLFVAGGLGLITVVATAVVYNPTLPPAEQSFDEGLSKLVSLLARVLLPLTLVVLIVYLIFIPFNFRAPFDNRDVLLIYNGMLFAIVALLVGATPVSLAGISQNQASWLRRGIIAVTALALIVSLYALAAILYRTAMDRLTPNRLTFIGWNVINSGLLFLLLISQVRVKEGRWLDGIHRAFGAGTVAYAAWTLAMILAIPWLFGINKGDFKELPLAIQETVYERSGPILFKCKDSPHIYLFENGEKRWINTIKTFNDQGYLWRDIISVACEDLLSIPDGVPIPANAGPPPQP